MEIESRGQTNAKDMDKREWLLTLILFKINMIFSLSQKLIPAKHVPLNIRGSARLFVGLRLALPSWQKTGSRQMMQCSTGNRESGGR
jgi:hypothetical protein